MNEKQEEPFFLSQYEALAVELGWCFHLTTNILVQILSLMMDIHPVHVHDRATPLL
ncbi:hypothetical protein [Evansella tamaricis]|uniref:Uncharacterized protein n=1 Tax=Evansella tamaricis TaxID=2069301 RepID=A0ABS6JJK7_9BACI|nr:hypothetical protein [Evansella tamaricis]MBU9713580.1 hypothetical protein [Evansella tamaricis]